MGFIIGNHYVIQFKLRDIFENTYVINNLISTNRKYKCWNTYNKAINEINVNDDNKTITNNNDKEWKKINKKEKIKQ